MSDHEKRAKEQKRQDRVRETRVIRDQQSRDARRHYKSVKNTTEGSASSYHHRNKHNRKDGT